MSLVSMPGCMQLMAYSSEPRLLLAGLHENLLNARVVDPSLEHTWAALDWLCAGAEAVARSSSTAAFALTKYTAVAGLGIHLHLGNSLKQKIAWPRNDAAVRAKAEQRHHVVEVCVVVVDEEGRFCVGEYVVLPCTLGLGSTSAASSRCS